LHTFNLHPNPHPRNVFVPLRINAILPSNSKFSALLSRA
jgi:hypothetical protein